MGRREDAEKLGTKKVSVLLRLLPMLRPHKGRFALAVTTLLIGSGLNLVYPQPPKPPSTSASPTPAPAASTGWWRASSACSSSARCSRGGGTT